MTRAAPLCAWCRHLAEWGLSCAAFPERIPDAILDGEHDHRRPHWADNGIQFEPANAADPGLQEWLRRRGWPA